MTRTEAIEEIADKCIKDLDKLSVMISVGISHECLSLMMAQFNDTLRQEEDFKKHPERFIVLDPRMPAELYKPGFPNINIIA